MSRATHSLVLDGMALRTSAWIWAKNKENRGCIGCHEDGERTPDNVFAKALSHDAADLMLPPERRRTVDFRRDIQPILTAKCASTACHGGAVSPSLSERDASHILGTRISLPLTSACWQDPRRRRRPVAAGTWTRAARAPAGWSGHYLAGTRRAPGIRSKRFRPSSGCRRPVLRR